MKRILLAASLAALPALLPAQGVSGSSVIVAPHFTSYDVGSGASKRTVGQMAVPIVILLPFTERFNMDVSTAFASTDVKSGGSSVSKISGLTDTQIRGNYSFLERNIVLTFGLNLPTGQYTIPEPQHDAAGQIGNDFLNYPISSMGNGLAGTGGVAYARAMGEWNLGTGLSFRKSTEFAAFSVSNSDFRFTPADEIRFNVGLDRPVGDGQVTFGLSYSAFGEDVADTTTYSTGDRLIASGSWSFPVKNSTVFLSGWNLYRMEGQKLGGVAPNENVMNLNGGVSFQMGEVVLQPNAEMRLWQAGGVKAGNMINAGVRARFTAGGFTLVPQLGMSFGNLYNTTDGSATDVSGFRGSLTVRWH